MPSPAVVAVVGAGNVGCALAADLSLRGVQVRLCTRSEARLQPIRDARALTVTGAVNGIVPISMLTTDLHQAVEGAQIIAVTVPTPALLHYAAALVAATTSEQLLWLNPGHSGGALYLAAQFRRAQDETEPRICQLSTASHGCRMTNPTTVAVFRLASAALAAFPARHLTECHQQLDALLPAQFSTAASVLELDLMNINAVMHPAQMVGNASWIEATSGDFAIYQEGTGPGVARLIEAVDAERLALADRLGVPATPFVELMYRSGFTTADAAGTGRVHRVMQAGEPIRAVKAPPTLDHRYLHEDVGWGLVPWMELARAANLATPTMAALTHLAGVINDIDYRREGLTLEKMGLDGMRPDNILDYVRSGHASRRVP
jgi:opine dehydrogenase